MDVTFGESALELSIANPLRRDAAASGGASGHGLIGMRERAALLGGSLEAGPRGGRFEVHADLPFGDRAP